MGQYYLAVVAKEDARNIHDCQVFHPRRVFDERGENYGNYMKLTEHGWDRNTFVLGVAEKIYGNPCRVAWMGDYADAYTTAAKRKAGAKYIPFAKTVHNGDKRRYINIVYDGFNTDGKFLVNHTTHQFIDLDKYRERCTDDNGWCLGVLSLLTAIGNGEGGGDYYGENMNEIGSWAWNVLSVEDEAPTEFEEYAPTFFDRCQTRMSA